MTRVWFITGVSSGLGTEISLKALQASDKVIGTVRSRQRAAEAVKKIEDAGGKCVELDVTDAAASASVYKQSENEHGRIDVLCNNAGASWLGPVEDFTDAESKEQMEVCFHGPLRLIQAALPGLRNRQSGMIINISSVAALDSLPACGLYSASKWAIEGLSESLAKELEPHNIKILLVEPGAFRTAFWTSFKTTATLNTEPYPAAQETFAHFEEGRGKQPGDAAKAASCIVDAVSGKGLAYDVKGKVTRLPLGPDCVERADVKMKDMAENFAAVREVAMSTNHE